MAKKVAGITESRWDKQEQINLCENCSEICELNDVFFSSDKYQEE